MKKGVAILSLAVYLIASCVIVINSHYCMKRLVAVKLFDSNTDTCSFCGMHIDKDNHCCHNELKVIKMINDQNRIPVMIYDLASFEPAEWKVSDYICLPFLNSDPSTSYQAHSPPLLSEQDNYILNSVFRI